MDFTYAEKNTTETSAANADKLNERASSLDALRIGAVLPTQEQMGRRVDFPEAMRTKMENAFGADLSAVKLYESRTVADAGAEAVTQGENIAFAPGMLDFTSCGGQTLLGHELSHVVSQARGEVRGSGFLQDPALEARADREGAMAAAGRQIAMPVSALTTASAAPAAGPMQASKKSNGEDEDGLELDDLDVEPESTPEQEEKPVESNGFFEGAFKGLAKMQEPGDSVMETFSSLPEYRKSLTEAAGKFKGYEQKAGDFLHVKKLQEGAVSEKLSSKGNRILDKMDKLAPTAQTIGNFMNTAGAFASVPANLMELGDTYEALDKANEFGTESIKNNAQADVVNSNLALGKSISDTSNVISKQFKTGAAKKTGIFTTKLSTGFDAAISGVNLVRESNNYQDSKQRKKAMAASAEALRQRGPVSEDDQEKIRIFEQGRGQAGLDQTQAGFNATSNALDAASGVSLIFGAPIASALKGAGKAVDFVGDEVMSYETDKFQNETVENKLHLNEDYQDFHKDQSLRGFDIGQDAIRQAQLESMGYNDTEEAFDDITEQRVDRLMTGLANNDEFSASYARNVGIDQSNIGKSEDHDKAIREQLLRSLGGSEKEKGESHGRDMMSYNAFAEGARQKELDDLDTRTTKQKIKDFGANAGKKIKDFGKGAWASVKTGAQKAVAGAKRGLAGAKDLWDRGLAGAKELVNSKDARANAWRDFKTGAGNLVDKVGTGVIKAAKGVKDFATNAETRRNVWESVKTGAQKAGSYALEVGKHAVNSRIDKVKDWYHEGVDQMNLHKDTYDKMGTGAKLLWSLKNLPARLTYGSQKNQFETVQRYREANTAAQAVKLMKERKEKQRQQAGA